MKTLRRTRYWTLSSTNRASAPAYNLKIHHMLDGKELDKAYDLIGTDNFYDYINDLIADFGADNNQEWQAGFNGRSGGYLVLYKGGTSDGWKSVCTSCGQRNYKTIEENGNICGRCHASARMNHETKRVFVHPGQSIDEKEVPGSVLKAFRRLALDIVAHTRYCCQNATVKTETHSAGRTPNDGIVRSPINGR